MNDWTELFYYFLIGAALLLSVQGMWFTAIMPGIDRWRMLFFRILFIVLILLCLSGFIEAVMLRFLSEQTPAVLFIEFWETIFLSIPIPMITAFILHCCNENVRQSKLFCIMLGVWAVYLFFVLAAYLSFFDGFFFIKMDGWYYRGPGYPLLLMPILTIELMNIAGTIRRRKCFSRKEYLSFLIALAPIVIATIVDLFVEIYPLIDISIVLSIMVMYSIILSDQIERDLKHQRKIARQQQEIANQRASIMVLQMRPHFIYNTMTSIYYLCKRNPDLAQQVTRDFTTYLRKNFTAIANTDPIPFSAELEHTRAYLAVEQAQYEESLMVDYDTPHIWFRVPPLTLQPIVENAIKHGRDPYAGVFHILIRTRKTQSGSEIVVSDNGRGFQPVETDEPHIALNNIRQRLESMCGGCLTIESADGGGTVVTVTIPDNTAENSSQKK